MNIVLVDFKHFSRGVHNKKVYQRWFFFFAKIPITRDVLYCKQFSQTKAIRNFVWKSKKVILYVISEYLKYIDQCLEAGGPDFLAPPPVNPPLKKCVHFNSPQLFKKTLPPPSIQSKWTELFGVTFKRVSRCIRSNNASRDYTTGARSRTELGDLLFRFNVTYNKYVYRCLFV